MRVRLGDIPGPRAALLRRVVGEPQAWMGTWVQAPRTGTHWLTVMGLLALGLGAVSLGCLVTGVADGHHHADQVLCGYGALGVLYGPLALWERVRLRKAELAEVRLLTPFNLVLGQGSHRPMELFRLSSARDFKRIREHGEKGLVGIAYAFEFDGGEKVRFLLRRAEDIQRADAVLELARAIGAGDPLPSLPILEAGGLLDGQFQPLPPPGMFEKILHPGSEFWRGILMFVLPVLVLWAVLRR